MENKEKDFKLANVIDKFEIARKKNKIQNTCFFNEQEISQVEKEIRKYSNYFFFGGYEEAARKILIVYPEKFTKEIAEKNLENIIKVINIKLPNEQTGVYTHSDYLSCLMKLGLERERFGDIIVFEDEAYIIVLNENAEYIKENLSHLTRLKKSNIEIKNIAEIKVKQQEYEEIRIVISSERLDNFVAELARCSRKIAEEYILSEMVLVNNQLEIKNSKQIKPKDIITIRGKGKYIVDEFLGTNKKERRIYSIKKYK